MLATRENAHCLGRNQIIWSCAYPRPVDWSFHVSKPPHQYGTVTEVEYVDYFCRGNKISEIRFYYIGSTYEAMVSMLLLPSRRLYDVIRHQFSTGNINYGRFKTQTTFEFITHFFGEALMTTLF